MIMMKRRRKIERMMRTRRKKRMKMTRMARKRKTRGVTTSDRERLWFATRLHRMVHKQ